MQSEYDIFNIYQTQILNERNFSFDRCMNNKSFYGIVKYGLMKVTYSNTNRIKFKKIFVVVPSSFIKNNINNLKRVKAAINSRVHQWIDDKNNTSTNISYKLSSESYEIFNHLDFKESIYCNDINLINNEDILIPLSKQMILQRNLQF